MLGSDLVNLLTGPHGVDRYTEQVDAAWTLAEGRAKVVDVRRDTPRSVTLVLAPNEAFTDTITAGQYVNLTVEIDGRRHTRCYSPANAEGASHLELTIGHHDGGLVSTHLYEHARRGMVVGLTGVGGDFVLPAQRPRRILFVSGGSGITPVLAMLRTLVNEGHAGEIAFVHYARNRAEACYHDELAAMPGVRVLHGYTRSTGGDLDGRFGARPPGGGHAGTRRGLRLRPSRFGRCRPRALRGRAVGELRAALVRPAGASRRADGSRSRTAH